MYPRIGVSPVDDAVLRHTAAVFDAVYNPGETALLRMAAACGAKTAGGMPMLVWQAVEAHACWYGASFENGDIRRLITDAGEEMAGRLDETPRRRSHPRPASGRRISAETLNPKGSISDEQSRALRFHGLWQNHGGTPSRRPYRTPLCGYRRPH